MRIVANLGIKDEVEIIERTVRHLRAIGVDLIIACDMYSTDGTAELLREFESKDDFWFTQMSDHESHEYWAARNLELVKQAGADWVMFLDADEFPIPALGSLRTSAALADVDVLSLDRFNIPLCPDGPAMPDVLTPDHHEDLLLLVDPIADFRTHLRDNPETPWTRKLLSPRVLARPERIGSLTAGSHDIVPADQDPLRRSKPADLLVAHLPFTTRARFTRKIDNVRKVFAVHDQFFGEHSARHWRRWVALADQGRLDKEFDRQVFDAPTIADLRDKGVIRSAAEVFRARMGDAYPPAG